MRIIAGSLKGRIFHEPHGHKTHPMSEKVRGALFNTLGDIEGLTFLDAFTGSGALAFEAISRGAKSVVAVEIDKKAHSNILKNIRILRLQKQMQAVKANVGGWSIHNMEVKFDVVLLDPPYDQIKTEILQKLMNRHIEKGGLAVLSYPGHTNTPDFERMKVVTNKNYGDSQLVFYRKIK
ncbi:16S rRNA (guanine(966)-N(2))-methyltransferase RsmD [Candidatus Saccharibacteria bacterium]|nr:16S rRNA (guanine(966)-N(2))-methyltransferase RsmD [Candidatus Saccharibacteria bacterium]